MLNRLLEDGGVHGEPLSTQTVHYVHSVLRRALNQALKWGIEPRNLVRHFKTLLQRADLPNIRFHDLRHGCATVLISQGVHPRIVMEIMGHSQISVTMNTYGHVLPETQREAVRLLVAVQSVQTLPL